LNKMKKLESIFISFLVIFSILLYFIDFMALDISYYNKFHKENNIAKVSNLSEKYVQDASVSLVRFLKNGKEEELKENFNKKEISHMKDVYKLFRLDRKLYKSFISISIIVIIYCMIKKDRMFFYYLKKYFLIVYFSLLMFLAICSMFFSNSFMYFHKIFFKNDLWLLDYDTDFMIRILPEKFFFTLFLNVLVLWSIVVFVIYIFIRLKKSIGVKI
jgi:hypothetical protein